MTTLLRTHIPTAVDSLLILYRWFRPSFLQSLLAKSAENMALTQVHYIMTYIHEAQRKKRNNKNKNESTNWHKWKCELVLFSTNTYITIHEDQCPYIAFNARILHSMLVYCIQLLLCFGLTNEILEVCSQLGYCDVIMCLLWGSLFPVS